MNALNGQNETALGMARANTRSMHWGFSLPPGVGQGNDFTMHQPATRDAMIKQLEEAAADAKLQP